MRRMPIVILGGWVVGLLISQKAMAVCPLCTVAVGAGIGVSRWLGIDDAISGLWVGGLIVSMVTWTESWLETRGIRFRGRIYVNVIAYFALIVVPLTYSEIIGNPMNAFGRYGLDKLFWGIVAGSSGFWFGASWYFYLKENHGGHAYFPFQKVVMPIAPLIFLSLIFYLLG